MSRTHEIACFGEVLWDCLPDGLFLGGAPLNVAFHARRMGARSSMISAVGDDFLGREALRRIDRFGGDRSAVAVYPSLPTGTVLAELDEGGNASYHFPESVAWDRIPDSAEARARASNAEALVYGSLAMRSSANRDAFAGLTEGFGGMLVMDVNLRPPFREREAILELARRAALVKLNHDELAWFVEGGGPGSGAEPRDDALPLRAMALAFAGQLGGERPICITLGQRGAALLHAGHWITVDAPRITVADTVGAGDAFTAALTLAFLEPEVREAQSPDLLSARLGWCASVGAFVASRRGAMPAYQREDLAAFHASSGTGSTS